MRVSGPSEAVKGDQLNFECSTSDSNPPVDIWWVVDGRAVQVREICNTRLNIKYVHILQIFAGNLTNLTSETRFIPLKSRNLS